MRLIHLRMLASKLKATFHLLVLSSFICLSVNLRAQNTPTISHLTINDPSGRLTIHGNFGPVPGSVEINNVNTPYSLWDSDSILCTIPDTGNGSCGPVHVMTANGTSNERLLSAWDIYSGYSFISPYGDEGIQEHIRFRLDLISSLHVSLPWSDSSVSSSVYITFDGPGNGAPLTYDTTVQSREIGLDLKNRKIDLGYTYSGYRREAVAILDQRFNVTKGGGPIGPHEAYGFDGSAYFIPSDSALYASVGIGSPSANALHATVFSQPTTVSLAYSLPESQLVSLSVYNMTGLKVLYVLTGKFQEAGDHTVRIDTKELPRGVIFFRFQSLKYHFVTKYVVPYY